MTDYRDLTPTQRCQLLDIELAPEQQRYAGDAASALYRLMRTGNDERRGLVLLLEDVPRALLLLERGAFLPRWAAPEAALISALQVDRRFQGQGLGRYCLQSVAVQVRERWPQVRCLQLSVDPDNHAALGLYLACGWVDSGTGHRAAIGFERCLSLQL